MTRKPLPASIPQSRLGRFARMGLAAGELAAGAATEGLKRIARGQAPDFRGALLSAPNARRLAARLARLRGAAMKIGQLVSLQGEDVLPPEFAQALGGAALAGSADAGAAAAPRAGARVRHRLGRRSPSSTTSRSPRHRSGRCTASTAADGRDLALKIQYPGVARSIASDVDNVAALLRLFNLLPSTSTSPAWPPKPSGSSRRKPTTSARQGSSSAIRRARRRRAGAARAAACTGT